MPDYEDKERFAVYNVVSAKDAYSALQRFIGNQNFNTRDAEAFFIEHGVTVWGLEKAAYQLSDKVNLEDAGSPEEAKRIAKRGRSPGRS